MVSSTLPIRIAVCALWLLAAGGGFVVILNYQNAAGRTGEAPRQWPTGTRIIPAHDRDTLLMFAHPQCPCTRASVEELNRLLARSVGKADVQVWFLKPAQFSDHWNRTSLWQSAAAIPGVTAHDDPDGAEARLFGAETSGDVLLYDTHGQLLFHGGITGSRGHAGDNAGEAAVISLLTGQEPGIRRTRVYGCSLSGDCDPSATGITK